MWSNYTLLSIGRADGNPQRWFEAASNVRSCSCIFERASMGVGAFSPEMSFSALRVSCFGAFSPMSRPTVLWSTPNAIAVARCVASISSGKQCKPADVAALNIS